MLKTVFKVTILVLIANSLFFGLVDFAKTAGLGERQNPSFSLEQPSLSPQGPILNGPS